MKHCSQARMQQRCSTCGSKGADVTQVNLQNPASTLIVDAFEREHVYRERSAQPTIHSVTTRTGISTEISLIVGSRQRAVTTVSITRIPYDRRVRGACELLPDSIIWTLEGFSHRSRVVAVGPGGHSLCLTLCPTEFFRAW